MKENNILLAEFLDIHFECKHVFIKGTGIRKKNVYKTSFGQVLDIGLKFHSDWNWLMLVVEKIKHISETERMTSIEFLCAIDTTDFDRIYNACVEFVKWYNDVKGEN